MHRGTFSTPVKGKSYSVCVFVCLCLNSLSISHENVKKKLDFFLLNFPCREAMMYLWIIYLFFLVKVPVFFLCVRIDVAFYTSGRVLKKQSFLSSRHLCQGQRSTATFHQL